MSKVINSFIKKAKDRSKSRGKQRGGGNSDTARDEHSDMSPMNDSPRSVAGSSIEELFDRHRSSVESAFDREHMKLPISVEGKAQSSGSTNPFESTKRTSSSEDFDLTEPPTGFEYDDFVGHDSGINSFDNLFDFSNHSGGDGSGGRIVELGSSHRSKSAGRAMPESDAIEHRRHRSKSAGRSERKERLTEANLEKYQASNTSTDEIKRKSKMEKILQLQEKNQRYKDEFRKVQKDRKALKKEVENKKLETASLTKEIDTHIAETSMLKVKLSEALRQLDQSDIDERRNKSEVIKLQKELAAVRGDYNAALGRVARMRDEIETLKLSLHEKERQVKSLSLDLAEQNAQVDALHVEISGLKNNSSSTSRDLDDGREALVEENERLQSQLGNTLERASSMVKEREDAIADLLRENEEMKRMLEAKDETENTQMDEELMQLRTELSAASTALEESQDRNMMLEEDVEAWIAKGELLEGDIQRLRDDVDAWQKKAAAAEQSMTVVETSAQEATKRATTAEAALAEAEIKFKELLQEQELKHTEALFDQKEKMNQQIAAARESASIPNPQDMMLQKAVADRKAKEAASKNGWGSVIQMYRGSTDSDEELSPDQKRIKELEAANLDREEEITRVKSEMVRLRSTYNDTIYTNKKRIEQLESENEEYAAKLKSMQVEVAALQEFVPPTGSGSSVASF